MPDPEKLIELDSLPAFRMRLHQRVDRYISNEIGQLGIWEPFETKVVRACLRPGDLFMDIGANIGWYTLIGAATVGPNGRVIAFEPEPENFGLLEKNVLANQLEQQVNLIQAAVSDVKGTTSLHLSDDNMGDHRIFGSTEARLTIEIPVTTLDECVSREGMPIRLIKMDTQGSEYNIFRGMRETLSHRARQSIMVIEFWPYGLRNAGTTAARLVDEFLEFRYRIFRVDEPSQKLLEVAPPQLRALAETEFHPDTGGFLNLLLWPNGMPLDERINTLLS